MGLLYPLPDAIQTGLQARDLNIDFIQVVGVLLEMNMGIGQTGQDNASFEVFDCCTRTGDTLDLIVGTNRNYPVLVDGQAFG